MVFNSIFDNNKRWIAKKLKEDKLFFEGLSLGQNPEILYIGCSDSRVSAEELMGVKPGEMFIHRNIGNMVVNSDLNTMSVINYAVTYLKVNHIIICGHYGCGGVDAALQPKDMGILNPWLRNIRDVYRLHKDELSKISDEMLRYERLIEINVEEQCFNVLKTAVVQKAYRDRGLKVHGWIFDIHTGNLVDLKVDMDKKLNEIMEIYRLD